MNWGEQKSAVPRRFTMTYTAEAIPAGDVVIETSHTLKYLRLRNGDNSCYETVFLVIDDKRHGDPRSSLARFLSKEAPGARIVGPPQPFTIEFRRW